MQKQYKVGDVIWANVQISSARKYTGRHLYVIISNNKFNKFADVVEAIPITSQRWGKNSPSHVDFAAKEIPGTTHKSTVIVEGRDFVLKKDIEKCVGFLNNAQLIRVAYAMAFQNPVVSLAFNDGVQDLPQFQELIAY